MHLACEGMHKDRSQRTVDFCMGPRDSNSGQHPYPPPLSQLPDAKACFLTWCSKGLSEHSFSPLCIVIDYLNFHSFPTFSFTRELHRSMLLTFWVFNDCPEYLVLLISNVIPLCYRDIFLNSLESLKIWFVLFYASQCSLLKQVFCEILLRNNVHSTVLRKCFQY